MLRRKFLWLCAALLRGDAESLFLCGTPDFGVIKFRTPTPTLYFDTVPKSDSQLKDVMCEIHHTDRVLKDDFRENLNSSNKKCTIVYSGVQAN